MADHTQVLTGTAELDDNAINEFDRQFQLSQRADGIADQFVTYERDIDAKSIEFTRYGMLDLDTTPLLEREDPDSVAMSDEKVLLIPEEHGKVITTTSLSNLQSGGQTNVAAAALVGIHAGRLQNKLALEAMDASTRVLFGGDATAVANVDAADEIDADLMEKAFSALGSKNSMGLPQAGGDFVSLQHDNVITSIRSGTAVGTWQDTHKYAVPGEILKNEVGMFKGFRIIKDNLATIEAGAGAGGIDVYTSYFMGFNALGKAVSQDPTQVISQNDKLNRFLNVGWKGCMKYGIIEQEALVISKSAKSPNAELV